MMTEKRLDKPGFVVVRWGLHGGPYVRTPVYAARDDALAARINDNCELVVPWKGTAAETLSAINDHDWNATRKP